MDSNQGVRVRGLVTTSSTSVNSIK